jgi:glutamyl-tRNA synthetase
MLSVVVDDFDMGVTHVIRGDDHLNNAARQMMVIEAMGWPVPVYAHIPLIHGPDGAKLSKRHGALAVEAYRDMGYLPEAMRNYLLRLGWSHGDEEIISTAQAIGWFDLDAVGRSAARFDFAKLGAVNAHWIRARDDDSLADLVAAQLEREPGRPVGPEARSRLRAGMPGLKQRARTIVELAESAEFYCHRRPVPIADSGRKLLSTDGRTRLQAYAQRIAALPDWTATALEAEARGAAEAAGGKLGEIAQPVRAALTGTNVSPPIFEVMQILGRDETMGRIGDALR